MKIIFVVTEDWYFWSHRLPMARAARSAGLDVGVATRVGSFGDKIKSEGFELHELDWSRGSFSVFGAALATIALIRIFRRERPDIVHNVAMKSVTLGGIAAIVARVPHVVNALTGLGYLFTSTSLKAKAIRLILHPLLKLILTRKVSTTLLQNNDNRALLKRLGYENNDTVIIRGSGIDIDHYRPQPTLDKDVVTVAFVGRIIETKGVLVLMEAHRDLRRKGVRCRLLLVGEPDAENPDAISANEIKAWAREPDVEWLGHCSDIRIVWEQAEIAVLPSTVGEGLPKSLLEAAACGRAIIASDVSGCREIAIHERNALLVPPTDVAALRNAIARLCADKALRERFGVESRRIVESDMSQARVVDDTMRFYKRTMAASGSPVGRGS